MPIYEYCCEHCEAHSEVLQGIHDVPLLQCTACGHNSLKRVLSASGFHLKGTGWYKTDFKTSGDTQKNINKAPVDKSSSTD